MKADHPGKPGLYGRYRFYTAGAVPRGHEEWAARRLDLLHWTFVYLAVELATLVVFCAVVRIVAGRFPSVTSTVVLILVLNILLAPFNVRSARARARRELAGPPAASVLAEIGEPVR